MEDRCGVVGDGGSPWIHQKLPNNEATPSPLLFTKQPQWDPVQKGWNCIKFLQFIVLLVSLVLFFFSYFFYFLNKNLV